MPEYLRSIVNRLRAHVGNRRSAPRYPIQLEAGLSLSVAPGNAGSKMQAEGEPLRLAGYTRDLSRTGLALILPSVHIGGQYLTNQNRVLEITLKLPSGFIQLHATPARYSPLEAGGKDKGYLVGLQITQMDAPDRARYDAYLDKLPTEI